MWGGGPGVHFLNRRGSRVPLLNFEEGPRSRVPGSQNLRSRSHGPIFTPSRLDHLPSFKTSVDARVEGLISNADYLESRRRNFTLKKYGRNTSAAHTYFVLLTVIFLFVWTFYDVDDS